jgi:uncharacterized membrane protein YkvA (DUF1232 family)
MLSTLTSRLSPRQREAFAGARRAAEQVVRRRTRLLRLAQRAYVKLLDNEKPMARVRDDLQTLLRLSKAWARREYRLIPWRSLVYAVAAIVYFVNPIDLIPDVLVGIGFIDDAAVIGFVVHAISDDLRAFKAWEALAPPPGDVHSDTPQAS